jgi:hypothetical protein
VCELPLKDIIKNPDLLWVLEDDFVIFMEDILHMDEIECREK